MDTRRSPRAIVVVLDSVGCGALPDAHLYGDEHANTLGNVARAADGLTIPHLQELGLGNITSIAGVAATHFPSGWWGRAAESSQGKDTTTGHWELMGLLSEQAFPTYPQGFPVELMDAFTRESGYGWIGNVPASGTEILNLLAEEHIRTGKVIVYTSADSVFQIAAHEEIIPVEELYRICQTTRDKVCVGDHSVGRIIARPFIGTPGAWKRTHRRRDFALPPTAKTVLDSLAATGISTHGVGKIGEIFAWRSVARSPHVENNMDAWDKLIQAVEGENNDFVFANLVDFDMLWGHRSDAHGYAKGLEALDERLPELLNVMIPGDLLIITADHGCDPTDESTDHTREYVPIVALRAGDAGGGALGVRDTFADIGATVADFYGAEPPSVGTSFLGLMVATRP